MIAKGLMIWRGILLLTAGLLVGLPLTRWWMVHEAARLPLVDPIAIAALTANATPPPVVDLEIPVRNPFSATGELWLAQPPALAGEEKTAATETATPASPALPDFAKVHGVLQLPSFTAMLTEEGFIPLGGRWGTATLHKVENEEVVFTLNAGEKRVNFQPDRQIRREQMKKLGVPDR